MKQFSTYLNCAYSAVTCPSLHKVVPNDTICYVSYIFSFLNNFFRGVFHCSFNAFQTNLYIDLAFKCAFGQLSINLLILHMIRLLIECCVLRCALFFRPLSIIPGIEELQ